jgi:hypothetical protein
LILTVLVGLLPLGCSTRIVHPGPRTPRPPADLAIDVTLLPAPVASGPAGEALRFVIEPDGQLRAATGAGAIERSLPPRTRALTDVQIADLYGAIVRDGLDLPAPPVTRRSARIIVQVIAHDRRSRAEHDPDESPEALELIERLRRLARLPG